MFTSLRDFAGGLATVSPSTATVESEFSLMKWEKNKFRIAQTDCSLEGILHYKQYEAILNINQSRLAIVVALNNRRIAPERIISVPYGFLRGQVIQLRLFSATLV
jgi:hypothetical protein